mgnify:CR=1 FL=1
MLSPYLTATLLLLSLVSCAHPESKLEFIDYCHFYNYPVSKHTVITEDGYILTLFRIQKKNTVIT